MQREIGKCNEEGLEWAVEIVVRVWRNGIYGGDDDDDEDADETVKSNNFVNILHACKPTK